MSKVYIETLGCPRNQADSDICAGLVRDGGFELVSSPDEAWCIIVNTCGFIEDAVNESIEVILSLSELKITGHCKCLIVAGCLSQRFQNELAEEMPEVDFFIGTAAYFQIPSILKKYNQGKKNGRLIFPAVDSTPLYDSSFPKIISTYPFAYLKIAEGCARRCSYCIIPGLRGALRSRLPEDILKEAILMAESGIKEIVLVAQETTDYGKDFGGGINLSFLLEKISSSLPDVWIRFMYGHPLSINDNLLETVNKNKNICPYFDIPVQHASDKILKRMKRFYDLAFLKKLVLNIRSKVEDSVLRTTIITGFPGEKDDDFKKILDFLEEVGFDHAGVFTYSEMEDIPSFQLKEKVESDLAENRRIILMEKQAMISQKKNFDRCGKVFPVLIENRDSDDFYSGRTMFQAPEVDGITYVDSKNLTPGDIVKVFITDSFDYDLAGNPI
ncbi:MAG: 30S ribosomal protein S12 methylthiotransferase RimO [Deltaproteobacteria bacterium]|nr:MAG: 30S ribosomal protein S12 methylthiotransferase RimO [Deltaproteobacteria bacterium]